VTLPTTIHAVHFPQRGRAAIVVEPLPPPGANQIVVRTEFSGVSNGTERSFLMGGPYGRSTWPCRCGYQTVGRIIWAGDGVCGYEVGQRVFSGVFKHHADYLAFDVSDPDRPTNITAVLPDSIDPQHAALFGVAAVSLHDVRRCGVQSGDRVLVVGAGLIGQFAVQAARATGGIVTLANPSEDRLRLAQQLGSAETVVVKDDEGWRSLRGRQFDVCIETSGADILHHLLGQNPGAPGVLRYGGKLFLSGGRVSVTYDCFAAQSQGLEFLHATHFKRADLLHLISLTASGLVKIGPLIRNVIPATSAPELYERMRTTPRELMGTVFRW
jgi:2-desacetyl-2-hydroxyethyl bacteriochlorophyllide A dehydrogenase